MMVDISIERTPCISQAAKNGYQTIKLLGGPGNDLVLSEHNRFRECAYRVTFTKTNPNIFPISKLPLTIKEKHLYRLVAVPSALKSEAAFAVDYIGLWEGKELGKIEE